jgi:predicted Zn-dependent protease
MVRDAFHIWTAAGAPVRFVFVSDSSRADVKVLWLDSLPEGRAGQVTRLADQRGWLRSAIIELSTRNIAGKAQDSTTVRAVALHEVGHLLGLEHSADERDIMAAWVTAQSLTVHDRFAMRALYDFADRRGDD